jgi:large subunit ribosomal protein L10
MALTKQRKSELLSKAEDIFSTSNSAVFVQTIGLGGNDTSAMRADMGAEEVGFSVIKKTLTKRALESANVEGEMPEFPAELAIAYGEDLVAPARLVRSFEKKFPTNISILGGIFEGRYMDKAAMTEIADIPPTDQLRGMFVNVINSPIQGMVIALSKIAEQKA